MPRERSKNGSFVPAMTVVGLRDRRARGSAKVDPEGPGDRDKTTRATRSGCAAAGGGRAELRICAERSPTSSSMAWCARSRTSAVT
jgi:hypothetical protein